MRRILDFVLMSAFDGVVAPGLAKVRFCVEYTRNRLPVIGSGAITAPDEVLALLQAGASLVEVAQGVPGKPRQTAKRLLKAIEQSTSARSWTPILPASPSRSKRPESVSPACSPSETTATKS